MASPFTHIRSKALAGAILSLLLAFAALLPAAVNAQDATPEPVETAAPDLPAITITVDEGTYSINVPAPVLEGQYLITVVNNTESLAVANLVLLPEEVTFGDLTSSLFTSFQGVGGELPEWWADASFAGGSWAGPGATSESVANLTAGRWTVFSGNPASAQAPQNITVVTEEEAIAQARSLRQKTRRQRLLRLPHRSPSSSRRWNQTPSSKSPMLVSRPPVPRVVRRFGKL